MTTHYIGLRLVIWSGRTSCNSSHDTPLMTANLCLYADATRLMILVLGAGLTSLLTWCAGGLVQTLSMCCCSTSINQWTPELSCNASMHSIRGGTQSLVKSLWNGSLNTCNSICFHLFIVLMPLFHPLILLLVPLSEFSWEVTPGMTKWMTFKSALLLLLLLCPYLLCVLYERFKYRRWKVHSICS